ncbi:LysR family transcriptional regulator [Acidovorax sp.]|uniref:helix-turn-helix domain-containing protein n=1 Tax=Acidovorax sp. TaxID=1872122 RepID=UPI003450833F
MKLRVSLNIARLDLQSLSLAVKCFETGSLTSAAPLCNMSLMCASRRLQRLEEHLGVPLFYRRKWGLEPTQAGLVVSLRSIEMLQLLDRLITDAVAAPGPIGDVYENCGRKKRLSLLNAEQNPSPY